MRVRKEMEDVINTQTFTPLGMIEGGADDDPKMSMTVLGSHWRPTTFAFLY